jgi:hypothetical protein
MRQGCMHATPPAPTPSVCSDPRGPRSAPTPAALGLLRPPRPSHLPKQRAMGGLKHRSKHPKKTLYPHFQYRSSGFLPDFENVGKASLRCLAMPLDASFLVCSDTGRVFNKPLIVPNPLPSPTSPTPSSLGGLVVRSSSDNSIITAVRGSTVGS